jgi:hypothetical protein
MLTAAAEMGVHSASSELALSLPTPPAPALPTPPASGPSPSCAAALPVPSYAQQLLSSAGLEEPLAQVDVEPDNRRPEPTVPRTLNNVKVKAAEIDDLFQV